MPDQASEANEVKMYSDFKSPYAYLAFDPAMALPQRFDVRVRWIPFQLRLKGKGERSVYSEYKVKYSYMDARRAAKPRGLWIRGPLKVYDTTPAAIGGLFADKHGRFLDYGRAAFKQFFLRELEADQPEAVARLLAEPRPVRSGLSRLSRPAKAARPMNAARRRRPRTTCSACRSSFSAASSSGGTTGCRCSSSTLPRPGWHWTGRRPRRDSADERALGVLRTRHNNTADQR